MQPAHPYHFCSHVPDKYLEILRSAENFVFLKLSFAHILTFFLLPITIVQIFIFSLQWLPIKFNI